LSDAFVTCWDCLEPHYLHQVYFEHESCKYPDVDFGAPQKLILGLPSLTCRLESRVQQRLCSGSSGRDGRPGQQRLLLQEALPLLRRQFPSEEANWRPCDHRSGSGPKSTLTSVMAHLTQCAQPEWVGFPRDGDRLEDDAVTPCVEERSGVRDAD
jgi:hypothetical protein